MKRVAAFVPILVLSCLPEAGGFPHPEGDFERGDGKSGKLDPAAWGSDHVGKPVPDYATGDECLFCHRNDVGPGWSSNRHATTLRPASEDSPALAALRNSSSLKEIAGEKRLLLLGGRRRVRFLKPVGYGRLSLLDTAFVPADARGVSAPAKRGPSASGTMTSDDVPQWNDRTFEQSCTGCHATGVDPETRSFSAMSLDCFVCHGEARDDHSEDRSKIHLSKKPGDRGRVVASICAQCHTRGGKSRTTGLPYPNNFVPGDNLWRDFEADFSDRAIAALSPADRHVFRNVRDVALHGKEEMTCLSCHEVHKGSSRKHRRLRPREICRDCHEEEDMTEVRTPLERRNATCDY